MPFSQTQLQQKLKQAEDDILKGEQRIAAQTRMIDELKRDGHDVALAERVLETLEETQAVFRRHRDIMLEEIGPYDAAESGTH